jgi:hypothetical protein
MTRIYILRPDFNKPSGGIRKLYHYADHLNSWGYDAFIVHSQPSWLVPLPYKETFHKIDFDDLDRLLIKLLRSAKTFSTIIDKIQKYFDPGETETEKDSLRRLVNLRLKRGCDNNLFDIIIPLPSNLRKSSPASDAPQAS